jgi:exosome complex component RRP41
MPQEVLQVLRELWSRWMSTSRGLQALIAGGGLEAATSMRPNCYASFHLLCSNMWWHRQSSRIATILRSAFQSHLHTHLYPHSTISIHVSVLSADGSLLAAAVNACTLALVDAGIPMPGLLSACTSGMSGSASTPRDPRNDFLDPILDLSLPEEQELPFLTVGTTTAVPVGEDAMDEDEEDMKVSMMVMDSKVHCTYLETMLAVGIDGCKQIREILEGVIKGTSRAV